MFSVARKDQQPRDGPRSVHGSGRKEPGALLALEEVAVDALGNLEVAGEESSPRQLVTFGPVVIPKVRPTKDNGPLARVRTVHWLQLIRWPHARLK